jgi:DNA-binding Xre family transcriptional regulator
VLDLTEPLRPIVDRAVLEFVKTHPFHAADFTIRSDGVCRLNPEMAKRVIQIISSATRFRQTITSKKSIRTLKLSPHQFSSCHRSSKKFLRTLRLDMKAAGGQRKLARESGVSRRTIERLVKGEKIRPSTLAKIKRVLAE